MNVPPNTSRGITTVFTIFRRLVKNHRKAQWDFWYFVSDKEKTTFYNIICYKFMLSKWITRNQKLVGTTSCVTVGSDKAMTGCLIIIYFNLLCLHKSFSKHTYFKQSNCLPRLLQSKYNHCHLYHTYENTCTALCPYHCFFFFLSSTNHWMT